MSGCLTAGLPVSSLPGALGLDPLAGAASRAEGGSCGGPRALGMRVRGGALQRAVVGGAGGSPCAEDHGHEQAGRADQRAQSRQWKWRGWTGLPVRLTPVRVEHRCRARPRGPCPFAPASLAGPHARPGVDAHGPREAAECVAGPSFGLRGGCWDAGPWPQSGVGCSRSRGTGRDLPRAGQLHDRRARARALGGGRGPAVAHPTPALRSGLRAPLPALYPHSSPISSATNCG